MAVKRCAHPNDDFAKLHTPLFLSHFPTPSPVCYLLNGLPSFPQILRLLGHVCEEKEELHQDTCI